MINENKSYDEKTAMIGKCMCASLTKWFFLFKTYSDICYEEDLRIKSCIFYCWKLFDLKN